MGSSRSKRTVTNRLCVGVLVGAAVVAATAGCSSDGTDHRATDLVLTQSELPDGFTVSKLGADELQQVTDQLHDSTKNVEVSPKTCAAPGSMVGSVDPKTTGVMAATTSEFSVSQSVQPVAAVDGGVDFGRVRDRVAGDCAHVRVAVTTGPIKGAEIDVRHEVLNLTGFDSADQLLVVESTSHTVNGARSGTKQLLAGSAVVNDFLITVEMTPVDGDGPVDRGLFTQILTRAVDKAAS
ncbi:hypothetical protein [Gordonia hydrophobica]|uniref:DUF5642 domain-containing protein n=1 Tax=Gordonia hydrophobica TaxID=40516 RepID=A0ABZ2U5X9_9ACTN|nr:hypothetical protein [Gordonia hydrophobica]MBM7369495.1 hypothetical protein [Gordonia hydrophobica]